VNLRAELAQRRRQIAARADAQRAELVAACAPVARRVGSTERFLRIAAWAAQTIFTARLLLRRRG
jgi:hypothetical protein